VPSNAAADEIAKALAGKNTDSSLNTSPGPRVYSGTDEEGAKCAAEDPDPECSGPEDPEERLPAEPEEAPCMPNAARPRGNWRAAEPAAAATKVGR
jgi:hypothetical protein